MTQKEFLECDYKVQLKRKKKVINLQCLLVLYFMIILLIFCWYQIFQMEQEFWGCLLYAKA